LLRIFLFPFLRKNIFHLYVIHVPLIKHINNPFVAPIFKAMHPLNLFTRMCGVQLAILELMVHDTTLFLWITIQNTFGSIQWQLNPVFLIFFHSSKSLLKPIFKNQSKHSTPTMDLYCLKILFLTSWHNPLYHYSIHPLIKWHFRTPSPSHCGNGPYTTSRCKSWLLVLALCFSDNILSHKPTAHTTPTTQITF
jgi:hypothetical protein